MIFLALICAYGGFMEDHESDATSVPRALDAWSRFEIRSRPWIMHPSLKGQVVSTEDYGGRFGLPNSEGSELDLSNKLDLDQEILPGIELLFVAPEGDSKGRHTRELLVLSFYQWKFEGESSPSQSFVFNRATYPAETRIESEFTLSQFGLDAGIIRGGEREFEGELFAGFRIWHSRLELNSAQVRGNSEELDLGGVGVGGLMRIHLNENFGLSARLAGFVGGDISDLHSEQVEFSYAFMVTVGPVRAQIGWRLLSFSGDKSHSSFADGSGSSEDYKLDFRVEGYFIDITILP